MSVPKYYYNPKTCRFELSRISITIATGYVLLFCITTILILVSALVLHSELFVTDKSREFKAENNALRKHYTVLQSEVKEVENVLVGLKQQDAKLHKKLFEVPLPGTDLNANSFSERNTKLLADASGFAAMLNLLKKKTINISEISLLRNSQFSSQKVTSAELNQLLSIPSVMPISKTESAKLVSGFGPRINPFHKGNYPHPGADFAAPTGTPIIATADGKVIKAIKGSMLQAGYGNYIEIDHGQGLVTRYAHLGEVNVKPGQKVWKGSVIGTVGLSGGTIAPHIHYEILRDWEQVDPIPFMMENLSSTEYIDLLKLGKKKNQSLD